ncbi:MAG TPA: GNAT family N-acetyltransferase [Burkholderiales bacterium]|nr:GNAT family N-acetyltransferase [Burkholderiales bacterium]
MEVSIRRALAEDAVAVALLAGRSFRDAFGTDNTPDDIEDYIRESFAMERVREEMLDASNIFLLAFTAASVSPVGYAKLRTGETEPSVTGPDPLELHRLYLEQGAIGFGVGAALMRASLDAAWHGGYRTLWLGVWERNPRAIAFYERWGFVVTGQHEFQLGSDRQTDLIMARSVEA